MTILTALATLYDRMKEAREAPPPGYSNEKIGGEVVLDAAGKVLEIRRQGGPNEKNKWVPNTLAVPAAVKRAFGIAEGGISIAFLNPYGRFLARVEGPQSGNVLLRRAQHRQSQQ